MRLAGPAYTLPPAGGSDYDNQDQSQFLPAHR